VSTSFAPRSGTGAHAEASQRRIRVALVGNPNTGKSTLFNTLTGMRQRVGNFAGVTVERVEGSTRGPHGEKLTIVDLPGCYALSPASPDEEIALGTLRGVGGEPVPDVVVVVADALHLERNLYLVSQVLELGLPTLVALNQVDAAAAAGVDIDAIALLHEIGAPVIPTIATRGEGIDVLRKAMVSVLDLPLPVRPFAVSAEITDALAPLTEILLTRGVTPTLAAHDALRLLAVPKLESWYGDARATIAPMVDEARIAVAAAGANPKSLEAELRYGWSSGVVARTVTHRNAGARTRSDKIDAVVLHRIWGPLLFLAVMGLVFQGIFTWAQPAMDAVEWAVARIGDLVGAALPDGDVRGLLVDGVIGGVGRVLVFLPQIAMLFLFIGVLEDSGYMARAAYLMDRLMRRVGLHGKSFIPMISGFACAVPAIMATRTIEEPKDRLATIMVVPLMSCSARLPVYTLLIGAFVPPISVLGGLFSLQGVTMLLMYSLGTVTALVVAAFFKRTFLKGPVRPMILEMPAYRLPDLRTTLLNVWHRVQMFLRRAGTIILSCSVILWALATYPKTSIPEGISDARAHELRLENSALGHVGKIIEPIVRPLGYDWKIGVSIAASFAAREVFVSTMGTIYGVGEADETSMSLRQRLQSEADPRTGAPKYTPLVAIGLMVFYVYALMCISTVAVTVREAGGGRIGWRWAMIQFGYMLALAYIAGLVVYQGGRMLGFE
jgi:ferrous iron transport protein B